MPGPLQLVVFGASGRTGRLVVEQALAQGHRVRAFVRDPAKLALVHPRLTPLVGDVVDRDAVGRAITGEDAVLCTLGARAPLKPYPAFRQGVRNIVSAMLGSGARRLIYLSFLGVRGGRHQLRQPFAALAPLLLPGSVADHEANEAEIQRSELDWTIVRPATLTNGPWTGRYRAGEDVQARRLFPTISRADVADFMLAELASPGHVRRAPALLAADD